MKKIAIIGGGISGLAVLHYLKQRLGDEAQITLFEREASVGGTIRSLKKDSCLFEWGPNGFLDTQPATLDLIRELGMTNQLIEANPMSRRRYIQINGNLRAVPSDLPFKDKCSLFRGILKGSISQDRSIYDYVSQRFSPTIAENLVDPFISGIYAGDIKRLHMASAFPKLNRKILKKNRMLSFKAGMGELIEALAKRYNPHIQTDLEISEIKGDGHFFSLKKSVRHLLFDNVIVATPAFAAARIVEKLNPDLACSLDQIPYAPVVVAGLLFKQDSFKKKPDGFGYLIPSKANKDILGVLIESNVYTNRAGDGHVMMRVMLGGAHHPAIINDAEEQILSKALKEIDSVYGLIINPVEAFVKLWPKAIPQYEINYPYWRRSIAGQCAKIPGLHLCANYLDGISFNDCIKNAKILAGML